MAIRTEQHDDLTQFGNRLWALMKERGYDTPQKLAIVLYNANLVSVNSKPNDFTTPREIYKNAVGSVEKKIRAHLHASSPAKVQGEFIVAYCAHFQCSADYLFGYTEIQSGNPDIRNACKLTGLTEKAIVNLSEARDEVTGKATLRHEYWSHLLEGDLFISLIGDILTARSAAEKYVICKAAEDAIPEALEGEDPSFEYTMVEMRQKEARIKGQEYYAAYYGMLHKLSQDITDDMDKLIGRQMSDEKIYEKALTQLKYQFKDLLYKLNGKPSPPKPDGGFHLNYHISGVI